MNDDLNKKLELLEKVYNDISNNGNVINEELLTKHPEYLSGLISCIRVATSYKVHEYYNYEIIPDNFRIDEYFLSKGLEIEEELFYQFMNNPKFAIFEETIIDKGSIKKYLLKIFNNIDMFKEIINDTASTNELMFLFRQYLDRINIKNISDDIIELFIEKIGKIDLLKYINSNIYYDDILNKLYKHFEFSISEVEELIKEKCYKGIELFKNSEEIVKDDKIVKELLKLGYYNIIQVISEEQFINNYNLIEPLLSSDMYGILISKNKLAILNNNEIFDKIFCYVDSSSFMNMFVKRLPDNYSDKVRITKCLLNGYGKDELRGVERFDENWLSNIELAIKDGYKCNQNTLVSTKEEVEVFIRNGQNQIINYVNKNILNYEFVYKCVEEGFNVTIDNRYSTYIINRYIKEFGDSKRVLHLKTWVYFFPELQYDFTADYIIEKSFTDDGPTNFFIDKILFKNYTIRNSIENGNKSAFVNNNYIAKNIIQYVDFINDTKSSFDFINKIEDIDKYFDKFGPNDKFYEHVFTSNSCFECLFLNNNKYLNDFKNKMNYFDYVINYLEFVHKNSLFIVLSNYVKNVEEIKEYYNGLGPTEKLYELGLLNSTLFNVLFRDQEYLKTCNFPNNIDNYIKYSRKNSIFEYVKSKKDIDLYFDEEGPTEELYQKALFDMKLFNTMYNDYSYRKKCNFSKEINSYIEYIKERKMMFNFVKSISDIEKYFNQKGPNQLFFENGFLNYSLFTDLLSNNKYKNYCKFSKSVEKYISFINKYGLIFDFIHNIEDINKYFDEDGATNSLRRYFKSNKEIASLILNNAAHDNRIINNLDIDFVDIFKEYIKDNFFNSIEESEREKKYNYLLKNIGPHIMFNLESPKIQRFIEIDNSELDKFFKTVYSSKVDVLTQELAYNNLMLSITRYNFEKANSDIINIFTNINSLLVNMDNDEFNNYIDGKLTSELSIDLSKYINDIIQELNYNEEDIEKLKKSLIKCKVELKEDDLRKICRKYVKKCRDKYTEEHKESIFSELNFVQSFDREDAIKKMSKYFIKEITFKDYCIYLDKFKDKIPNNEYNVLKSITLEDFNLIINTTGKPDPRIVKKLKPFNMLLNEYSKFEFDNRNNDSLLDFLNVKKKYYIQLKDIDMINIIKELDIDIFLNTIGNDKEILDSLSKLFKNCYLGRLPENISLFFCSEYESGKKLPGGINNIGTFITKYAQILSDKKRRLEMQGSRTYQLSEIDLKFADIVKLISDVNTETREISRLIGTEEYGDFVSNESPNTNSYDRLTREGVLVDLLDYLYTLDKITIPSKDIIISNKANSKQINFIVGNRTNPSNICHGERTGACMRVGGVGEGLFLKCLTDKNWFHIRIEDPVTHEYISRVSGFRNGNTVYLNQLRESSNISKYTNEDLQEFIQIYAESLIEETKSCEYPIENVFINGGIGYNCYAMKTFRSENGKVYSLGAGIQSEYSLDEAKQFKLRESNDIWTDVKNSAVLLATTEEGKKTLEGYAPLKNGPDDALEYSVARDKIYGLYHDDTISLHQFIELDEIDIYEKINRVYCMKQKLLGYDYKYLDDISVEGIIDAYVSSDWYVYIDSNYEIHYDFISEYKLNDELVPYGNAEDAHQEMEHAKQILINKYSLDIKNEVKHAI